MILLTILATMLAKVYRYIKLGIWLRLMSQRLCMCIGQQGEHLSSSLYHRCERNQSIMYL